MHCFPMFQNGSRTRCAEGAVCARAIRNIYRRFYLIKLFYFNVSSLTAEDPWNVVIKLDVNSLELEIKLPMKRWTTSPNPFMYAGRTRHFAIGEFWLKERRKEKEREREREREGEKFRDSR